MNWSRGNPNVFLKIKRQDFKLIYLLFAVEPLADRTENGKPSKRKSFQSIFRRIKTIARTTTKKPCALTQKTVLAVFSEIPLYITKYIYLFIRDYIDHAYWYCNVDNGLLRVHNTKVDSLMHSLKYDFIYDNLLMFNKILLRFVVVVVRISANKKSIIVKIYLCFTSIVKHRTFFLLCAYIYIYIYVTPEVKPKMVAQWNFWFVYLCGLDQIRHDTSRKLNI